MGARSETPGDPPALRDWLDRYFDVGGVSESGIELLVLDAILDASLPAPTRQHWVHLGTTSYRLDLAYPGRLVAAALRALRGHLVDS